MTDLSSAYSDLSGMSAEKILDTDWGNIFIAYYPLHNESGEVVGALGIEVAADIEAEAVHDKSIIQRHGKY